MSEVGGAFSTRDFVETSGDGLAQAPDGVSGALEGIGGDLAEDGFELGEQLFDGVEIGAVCRKVDEICATPFNGFLHAEDFVDRNIVHEHDVASLQGRSQNLLDIGPKRFAVHRAFEHERRADTVVTQRSDECCCLPVAVQHLLDQALTAWGAPIEAGDVAGDGGFIDENQSLWIEPWLPASQGLAIGCDVRPVLLGGVQAFF